MSKDLIIIVLIIVVVFLLTLSFTGTTVSPAEMTNTSIDIGTAIGEGIQGIL